MTSRQAKVDAAKTAVSSITTCTPAIVVNIKSLLTPEASSTAKTTTKVGKTISSRAAKPSSASRSTSKKGNAKAQEGDELDTAERASLATFIINVALKALSDAAKPARPASPTKRTPEEKKGRRRSNSTTALSPLRNRTLNRVSTTPNISVKESKSTTPALSTGCLAMVECTRVAFACLRSMKGPLKTGETDLQLEQGSLSLIGKLVALEMHDQAIKELRSLKRRLDPASSAGESNAKSGIGDLLDFQGEVSTNLLAVVTSYQLQVLRIISTVKRPSYVEAILPFLRETYVSAPVNLLAKLFKRAKGKEADKTARQTAALSSVVLSLNPGVSTKDDAVAMEPRLSPSPTVVFELQVLALRTQLRWWTLAGHQGKIDEEVLAPLARCMRAFLRRVHAQDEPAYCSLSSGFESIKDLIDSDIQKLPTSSDSPMASIYQVLGSAAQSCRRYRDAHRWYSRLQHMLDPARDSSVKFSTVLANLLSVALKIDSSGTETSKMLIDVTKALDGGLSGTAQELNELLESLSSARKAVVVQLMKASEALAPSLTSSFRDGLQQFLLRFPRFQRRWLGVKPGKEAATKQVLQYDQRRQVLLQSIGQVLDAVLMVVKTEMQGGRIEWQKTDEVLQDCTGLLHSVVDDSLSSAKVEQLDNYHVKISSLYYSYFNLIRSRSQRSKEMDKQALQSLSRSINAAKNCSPSLKTKAQISSKLELFANLCKASGRIEEAVKTLRSLCTNMVEDGILSEVTCSLENQSPVVAWASGDNATLLSRALRSLAKLDKSWNDWTFFLPEPQRAAVLEHLLHIINASVSTSHEPLGSTSPGVAALLRIYSLEKHPIRRLRVLLHLVCQRLGNDEEAFMLKKLLEPAMEQVQSANWGEDKGLSSYARHLKVFCDFVTALSAADEKEVPRLTKSMRAWEEIVQDCQNRSTLVGLIDHPEELVSHLKSAAEYAHLKGNSRLQLQILNLSANISRICASTDTLIATNSVIASQYVAVGLFSKAFNTIEQTEELIRTVSELPQKVKAGQLFCRVEYYSGIGSTAEALDTLEELTSLCNMSVSSWPQSKPQMVMTASTVSLLQSILQLQQGHVQEAFAAIRSSVRMLSHEWAKLETASAKLVGGHDSSTADNIDVGNANVQVSGPVYWAMAHPLLKSLLHLSTVYAHIGMFQETVYYANTAWKIAESTQSSLYKAEVSVWTGSVYGKAFQMGEATSHFIKAEPWIPTDSCSSRVHLLKQTGDFYLAQGNEQRAQGYFELADETARQLNSEGQTPNQDQQDEMVSRTSTAGPTATRGTRSRRGPPSKSAKTPKRVASKAEAASESSHLAVSGDLHQTSLIAGVALSRVIAYIHQKNWASAMTSLEAVKALPKLLQTLSQEQIVTATSLIGHSMEQMIHDPVFSVMPDSTISFPAISASSEKSLESSAETNSAQTKKTASKQKLMPAFAEALQQAQDLLLDAHAESHSKSDSAVVHRIATLLQNTVMILSATTATKSMAAAYSTFAMVAADMARNITWRRERKTLDPPVQSLAGSMAGLSIDRNTRRSSLAPISDLARFQTSYIDNLPPNWNVVSLFLSDNQHDLCLTSYRTGHSPFVLRLPLERASSRDTDSEAFDFQTAHQELLAIVKLADETSHSARDFTARGERNAWWAEREALDQRLGELLKTIETSWLGGFKGIFSRHSRRSDLLARFRKSFQQMLDGCLPSRKTAGRRKGGKQPAITLDPRILDLFIGLGDPSDADLEFDEALDDLLYFVVDILQFHGERNAYDEIDFDAMVVETYDALRGYHDAAKFDQIKDAHTILVLDKALHAFPWESLPCLQGQAVSRVPSLAYLKQLLHDSARQEQDEKDTTQSKGGHYVSAQSGTYILNPSADLKNTQAFFQPSFSTLRSWTGVVKQEPQEADFEDALSNSDIFLYFGHGSGAQYVRSKTVRKLEKCKPATFLMGCSSVALSTAGEFECYGPVWNYMMAGCPAVVGALWDVTDRDIDRFAGRAFEEWGLFPRGSFKERKKSKEAADGNDDDDDDENGDCEMQDSRDSQISLVEAVAKGREVCKLRYLNAAAVVVYGIPVYIRNET